MPAPARLRRLSAVTKKAVELMVLDGLEAKDAAEKAGMKHHSLREALKKPHVKQYREALRHAHLTGKGERAIAVLLELMETASSEHVRLEAAKHIAALTGIRPIEEVKHHHHHGIPAGYVLEIQDYPDDGMKTIDAALETSDTADTEGV